MVLALIEALGVTKGLKEAIPFLTKIVNDSPDLSARAILKIARDAGLRFSDAPAFNIVAQLKANLEVNELFGITKLNELPSLRAIGKAISPMTRNYQFVVTITGYNPLTGEREDRSISVMSDNLLTPEQIYESALNIPKESPGSQMLTNATVKIVGALKSPYVRG